MTASLESLQLQQEGLRLGSRNAFLNVVQWDRRCRTVARSPLEVCDCAGRGAPGFLPGSPPLVGLKIIPQITVAPMAAYSIPFLECSKSWRAPEPRSLSCLAWQSPLPHHRHYTPRGHNLNLCQSHTHHCPGWGGRWFLPAFPAFPRVEVHPFPLILIISRPRASRLPTA